jgi:hypothetical protein
MGTALTLIQRKVVAAPQLTAHMRIMRTLALASLLVLASAAAASAQCVSLPDDASTGYTANQTALAVCRQMELGDTVRDRQFQQQIDAKMRQLEQMRLNDQLDRAQAALPVIPAAPVIPSF